MNIPHSAASSEFGYQRGLRQGDSESSPQFDDVMDYILLPLVEHWEKSGLAFVLPDSHHAITLSRMADTIYLFARGIVQADRMLGDLLLALWTYGLDIHEKSRQFLMSGS
eukprot:TRINITY_DN114746_c0_g1_i1.p1 TRINITY_DN114746_c0_g1~~TRINITY_DN114746_c0_g1_i1.p1  ORF type:complete len:110 (+),score=13.88 TRINITY_DN114746_c0_g1_i1:307-636(+)